MKILSVSDFDLRGAGYQTIAAGVLANAAVRGHEVVVYGFDYAGMEHPYPFTLIPSDPRLIGRQIPIAVERFRPDVMLVFGDLTLQDRMTTAPREKAIYAGVFAIEGVPFIAPSPWAATIRKMDLPYAIAEFGRDAVKAAGVECRHLPMGVDAYWHPATADERDALRKAAGFEDAYVILTVADNQERKNLPAAAQTVMHLRERGHNVVWMLVTKPRPAYIGWNLWAMAKRFGIEKNCYFMEQGVPREKLRECYQMADVHLITSKAEGYCLPILEGMGCGLPAVATNTCEMPILLGGGRGFLIDSAYTILDPFGNTERELASPEHAADLIEQMIVNPQIAGEMRVACVEYANQQTWARSADVILEDISVEARKAATKAPSGPFVPQWGAPSATDAEAILAGTTSEA